MELENLFEDYGECYDRFTFDILFRKLLGLGYSHEEAKDLILYNCSLSAIIFQERLYNKYYNTIKQDDLISEDLKKLINETFNANLPKHMLN